MCLLHELFFSARFDKDSVTGVYSSVMLIRLLPFEAKSKTERKETERAKKKMAKKRERIVNTEPFITHNDDSVASCRKRSKLVEAGISSKIMKVALAQQKEIADGENAERNPSTAVFSTVAAEEEKKVIEEEDDIDDFDGKFKDESYQEDINEDDEKLFESFFVKNAPPQQERPDPQMDPMIAKLYKGVAKLMSEYTVGKMPKAFVHITKMERWQDVLYLTEPEKWSPNAMCQATRIFAHHLKNSQIQRFYNYVLLPRVREDIRKNKRLHFALYQAVKKSLYKPSAFNKGILFPLCKSGTCSLREAVILGSILEKCSFPVDHSGIALLNLAEMEYCGTTRYKYELLKEDKEHLQTLIKRQNHHLVTPEIVKELQVTTINNPIKEDRFDIPEVPMEED
ncbi:hypothetical protein Bca101_071497 [Brassica carinata]